MPRPPKLTDSDIVMFLQDKNLAGWSLQSNALFRLFHFDDFVGAWGFMCKVALLAEKLDHHPDWKNIYNKVEISLNTHDAGGVTTLDLALARQINGLTP